MYRNISRFKKLEFQIKKVGKYGIGFLGSKLCEKAGVPVRKRSKDYIYTYLCSVNEEDYKGELKFWYESTALRVLDLDNPISYNEKCQWLKLYDNNDLKMKLVDKYLVRDWIRDIGNC